MLKSGKNSTEFWALIGLFVLVGLSVAGVLRPERIQQATVNVQETAGALPSLVNAVKDLAAQHGQILVYAGLAWAYIKRRSSLKAKELDKEGGTKK
jgi:hypothetical protein